MPVSILTYFTYLQAKLVLGMKKTQNILALGMPSIAHAPHMSNSIEES
jgi:hypothetical protein